MSELNKKLLPNIRFPEFDNAREWVNKPFFDGVLVEHKDKSDGKCQVYSVSVNKGVVNQVEHLGRSFSAADTSKYNLVRPYDVIYTKSPTGNFPFGIVKQNLNSFNVIVSPLYGVFSPTNKYVGYIIDAYFESPTRTNSFLSSIVQKGAKNTIQITNSTFLSKGIPLPIDFDEQKKIADCLSSLDDLITAQNQKVGALKQHKKGLMQQLFPAEGETVSKLRFPEFENAKEWELASFSEVYNLHTTNSYSRDMLNYEIGTVKNIHYGDIHTKFQTLFDITKETVPFIKPSESLDKIKPESYCVEGDMIFADASEDLADVGKSIEIVNLNKEPLLSGLHTLLARQKDNKLVIGFGGHLFKSAGIRKQIQKESQGAKVLGISGGRLSGIKVYFPSDKQEQQKIADCLSSIDELITTQTQQLEAYKTHKKGLMQQLFPALEETTL